MGLVRVTVLAIVCLLAVPAAATAKPLTLGSRAFADAIPTFYGIGEVRPSLVGNGNTCAGQASDLVWKRWGKRRARATGSMCDSPDACSSACATTSDVQLVAYDRGRCTGSGARVYRKARWRVRDVDDGSWKPWSSLAQGLGRGNRLCRSRF
jgi:hypothetical protein